MPEATLHIWTHVTMPLSNLPHHLSLAFPSHHGNVFIVRAWLIAFVPLRLIVPVFNNENIEVLEMQHLNLPGLAGVCTRRNTCSLSESSP